MKEQGVDRKSKSLTDILQNDLTMEVCGDLTYLGYVIQEALRFNPPASNTTAWTFSEDVTLGENNLKVKAGTNCTILIYEVHRNSSQWQRPLEFLPDRFDNFHPLSKTPSGEKRHTFSWMPFNGGKRVCFGKTFAELNLKIICAMMAMTFDYEWVEKGKYTNASMPQILMNQSNFP